MGSVFDKEPLHACFNALLLYLESSTVFWKCWNWQLCWPLARAEQSSIQTKQPKPRSSGKLQWGTQREASLSSTVRRMRVMSGAPKIPEGRIQQTHIQHLLYQLHKKELETEGEGAFTLVGFLHWCHQGLSLPESRQQGPSSLLCTQNPLQPHQSL